MSFLARFRVLTKILAVVVLMALVASAIGWIGIRALDTLNEGAGTMSRSAKRALEAARTNVNITASKIYDLRGCF